MSLSSFFKQGHPDLDFDKFLMFELLLFAFYFSIPT